MADMRSCIKTGCRWPAAATLAYRYATAEVWLSDLTEDDHPATHDLCPHHADALTIPRGWTIVDDRRPAEAVREPSAAEIVERVTTLRRSVDAMLEGRLEAPAPTRSSRYEALLDTLPTYDPPEVPPPAAGAPEAVRPAVVVVPEVAHEVAPIARDDLARPLADRIVAEVHETGLRGAVVLTLPLRVQGEGAEGEDGGAAG